MEAKGKTVWSTWQERKVEVCYVSPVGLPGTFRRIGDALGQAKEGSRIEVAGGVYHEQLVMTKTVELVAEEGANPEVTYRGNVLCVLSGVNCLIEGVNFIQKESMTATAAIMLSDCNPILRKCTTDSVDVKGSASPLIEDCTISGSGGVGCSLRGLASGRFLRNSVYNHGGWCIEIDTEGAPLFQGNRVFCPAVGSEALPGGRQPQRGNGAVHVCGTRASSRCCPVFEDNFISDTGPHSLQSDPPFARGVHEDRCVILIASGCRPAFRNNEIFGGVIGIRVRLSAAPQVQGNIFRSFDRAGLFMNADASESSQIDGNTFQRCVTAGVMVHCEATVVGNEFNGPGDGVLLAAGSRGRLLRNDVNQGQIGFRVSAGADAHIEANQLRGCAGPCILMEGTGTVEDNLVSVARLQGIVCHGHGSRPRIVRNTVEKLNRGAGIAILRGASPTVEANKVVSCLEGIAVADKARGLVLSNTVVECETGIVVQGRRTAPLVVKNHVFESRGCGVLCCAHALGRFVGNKVSTSQRDGFHACEYADPCVLENVIADSGHAGIRVSDSGRGTFTGNSLERSQGSGIEVADEGSEPLFRANIIETGRWAVGVACKEGARGLFEKNKVPEATIGLEVTGRATDPSFIANIIGPAVECGAKFGGGCSGFVFRNEVFGAKGAGIVCCGGAAPHILRNTVRSVPSGIVIEGGGPHVEGNMLDRCSVVGLVAGGLSARPSVVDNTFGDGNVTGVIWECSAEGTLSGNRITGGTIGMRICGHAAPVAESNFFTACSEAALCLGRQAGGTVRSNTLEQSGAGVVVEAGTGTVSVTTNTIRANTWGVWLRDTEKGEQPGSGKAVLSGNTISGSEKANVLSESSGHASLERNTIEHSPVGIFCRCSGLGLFKGNRLTNHSDCSIRVTTGARPIAHSNVIEKSPVGIEVVDSGEGQFEANLFGGGGRTLTIARKGHPVFRNSKFSGRDTAGTVVSNEGWGEFRECEFSSNEGPGVRVLDGGRVNMDSCKVVGNGGCGVVVGAAAQVTVARSSFKKNKVAGIAVEDGGKLVATDTTLEDNRVGILFARGSSGDVRGCAARRDSEAGFRIVAASPSFEANVLEHQQVGVDVREKASPSFTKNDFVSCQVAMLSTEGSPRLDRNSFRGNETACSLISTDGELQSNTFTSNKVGVRLVGGSLSLQQNVFRGESGGGVGIHAAQGSSGLITSCTFGGLEFGVDASIGCGVSIRECTFERNTEIGVRVSGKDAKPSIRDSTFSKCKRCGVLVEDGGSPSVVANTFAGEHGRTDALPDGDPRTWAAGIVVSRDGLGRVSQNRFRHQHVGCAVRETARPTIEENMFEFNVCGAVISQAGDVTISANLFRGNLQCGLLVVDSAAPRISGNAFVHHTPHAGADKLPCGAEFQSGGGGKFEGNLLLRNAVGVRTVDGGNPAVSQSLLSEHFSAGVEAVDGGAGVIKGCSFSSNTADVACLQGGNITAEQCSLRAVRVEGAGHWRSCVLGGPVCVHGDGASPLFENCQITSSGMSFEEGALGRVVGCTVSLVSADAPAGLQIKSGASPTVTKCTFASCASPAAALSAAGGKGTFEECTFYGGRIGAEIRDAARPTVTGCRFEHQKLNGVLASGSGAAGFVTDCGIMGAECGVLCGERAETCFERVEVYDSRKYGVHALAGTKARLVCCALFDTADAALRADADSLLTVVRCEISHIQDAAIEKDSLARGSYDSNKVRQRHSPLPKDKRTLQERTLARRQEGERMREMVSAVQKRRRNLARDATAVATRLDGLWEQWGLDRAPQREPTDDGGRTDSDPRSSQSTPLQLSPAILHSPQVPHDRVPGINESSGDDAREGMEGTVTAEQAKTLEAAAVALAKANALVSVDGAERPLSASRRGSRRGSAVLSRKGTASRRSSRRLSLRRQSSKALTRPATPQESSMGSPSAVSAPSGMEPSPSPSPSPPPSQRRTSARKSLPSVAARPSPPARRTSIRRPMSGSRTPSPPPARVGQASPRREEPCADIAERVATTAAVRPEGAAIELLEAVEIVATPTDELPHESETSSAVVVQSYERTLSSDRAAILRDASLSRDDGAPGDSGIGVHIADLDFGVFTPRKAGERLPNPLSGNPLTPASLPPMSVASRSPVLSPQSDLEADDEDFGMLPNTGRSQSAVLSPRAGRREVGEPAGLEADSGQPPPVLDRSPKRSRSAEPRQLAGSMLPAVRPAASPPPGNAPVARRGMGARRQSGVVTAAAPDAGPGHAGQRGQRRPSGVGLGGDGGLAVGGAPVANGGSSDRRVSGADVARRGSRRGSDMMRRGSGIARGPSPPTARTSVSLGGSQLGQRRVSAQNLVPSDRTPLAAVAPGRVTPTPPADPPARPSSARPSLRGPSPPPDRAAVSPRPITF